MKQDLVHHAKFEALRIFITDMYLIVALFKRQQLTADHLIVQNQFSRNHIALLHHLPYIKRNMDHISVLLLLDL